MAWPQLVFNDRKLEIKKESFSVIGIGRKNHFFFCPQVSQITWKRFRESLINLERYIKLTKSKYRAEHYCTGHL